MSYNRTLTVRAGGLAVVLAAVLAGCASQPEGPLQLTPTEQFGVQVTSHPEQIAIGLHRDGLSANQKAALGQFVSQWREDGGGPVTVRAPVDGADLAAAARVQRETKAYLVQLGVPSEQLQVAGYTSNRAPGAPLLASYDRFEALGPNCSSGWTDLAKDYQNKAFDHFGCAMIANTAAQVANARDFLAPAVETPADNPRRQVIIGKYRLGETTSSVKDDQADGKVSGN